MSIATLSGGVFPHQSSTNPISHRQVTSESVWSCHQMMFPHMTLGYIMLTGEANSDKETIKYKNQNSVLTVFIT